MPPIWGDIPAAFGVIIPSHSWGHRRLTYRSKKPFDLRYIFGQGLEGLGPKLARKGPGSARKFGPGLPPHIGRLFASFNEACMYP